MAGVGSPATAVGSYSNGLIADKALAYVGQWGGNACRDAGKFQSGQCKQFVNCIVAMVSGGTQWPVDPGQNYQNGYSGAGGIEVTLANAVKGDIMQLGQADTDATTGNLHTAIVVENKGNGLLSVVDSNYNYDEVVSQHDYTPRPGARFWRMGTVSGNGGGAAPDNYFHGTPPDNAVIENHDGGLHKYVALGGSLIYVPETEYIWNYIHEMEVKIPSGSFHEIVWMHNDDIHAIEYGFGGNRSHVPADGSFFYERGSQQQYVMRFGYAFPVNGMGELEYLGGVNRAVMVPPGTAQRLSGTPGIPNDVLFRSLGPTLYHEVNGTGFWVPNTPTADCIRVAKHAEFRPVPDSLLANQQAAGRLSMQPTNCTFPHGQVLYGQPSGRQAIVLYGKGFAIGSPQEAAAIGAVNLAQPVADQTIDMLLGLASQVPDGHVFRAGLETAAYQYASGTLRPIDAPLLRDCLLVGGNLGSAEEVVPQSFIAAFAVGASASCQLDNRQLLGPDGASVGYIKDGTRHWVPNPAVRDCLAARSGTGQPVQASSLLWNSYSQGSNAYCPYHLEPGLNFVQEQGSPIVWLVGPAAGGAGMKRHAGSLCVPDPYTTPIKAAHVFMVPAGETAGLVQGADWWPTGADCQALPG